MGVLAMLLWLLIRDGSYINVYNVVHFGVCLVDARRRDRQIRIFRLLNDSHNDGRTLTVDFCNSNIAQYVVWRSTAERNRPLGSCNPPIRCHLDRMGYFCQQDV